MGRCTTTSANTQFWVTRPYFRAGSGSFQSYRLQGIHLHYHHNLHSSHRSILEQQEPFCNIIILADILYRDQVHPLEQRNKNASKCRTHNVTKPPWQNPLSPERFVDDIWWTRTKEKKVKRRTWFDSLKTNRARMQTNLRHGRSTTGIYFSR